MLGGRQWFSTIQTTHVPHRCDIITPMTRRSYFWGAGKPAFAPDRAHQNKTLSKHAFHHGALTRGTRQGRYNVRFVGTHRRNTAPRIQPHRHVQVSPCVMRVTRAWRDRLRQRAPGGRVLALLLYSRVKLLDVFSPSSDQTTRDGPGPLQLRYLKATSNSCSRLRSCRWGWDRSTARRRFCQCSPHLLDWQFRWCAGR